MIYATQLDTQTGEISADSGSSGVSFRYNQKYLVITDNTDTPADIYKNAASKGLPVYGAKLENVPLFRISIDRWDDNNLKAAPTYGLGVKRDGSYTAWSYEVEYSDSNTSSSSGGSSSSEKAPWENTAAQNCNLSTKEYEWYSNICYAGLDTNKTTYLRNAVGDTVYRNRTLRNGVLTFDYAVKKFNANYIRQAICTLNMEDIVVAGIPIPAYYGLITGLNVSRQEWTGGGRTQEYFNIHAEIEIAFEKDLRYTPIMGTGFNAKLSKNDKSGSQIHEWISNDTTFKNRVPDKYWFDKDLNLGSFADIPEMKNNPPIYGTHYEKISEAKVLAKDGTIYKVKEDTPIIDMEDPTMNIVRSYEYKTKKWSYLGFPTKGMFFE